MKFWKKEGQITEVMTGTVVFWQEGDMNRKEV